MGLIVRPDVFFAEGAVLQWRLVTFPQQA